MKVMPSLGTSAPLSQVPRLWTLVIFLKEYIMSYSCSANSVTW